MRAGLSGGPPCIEEECGACRHDLALPDLYTSIILELLLFKKKAMDRLNGKLFPLSFYSNYTRLPLMSYKKRRAFRLDRPCCPRRSWRRMDAYVQHTDTKSVDTTCSNRTVADRLPQNGMLFSMPSFSGVSSEDGGELPRGVGTLKGFSTGSAFGTLLGAFNGFSTPASSGDSDGSSVGLVVGGSNGM